MSGPPTTLYVGNLSKTFRARKMAIRKAREFGRISRYKFLMNGGLFKGIIFLTYTKHVDAARALKRIGPQLKNCVGKRFSEAVVRWAKASHKPPKTEKGRTKSSARASEEDFTDTWKFVKRRIEVALTNAHTMFSNAAEIMEDPKQDPVIAPPWYRYDAFPRANVSV